MSEQQAVVQETGDGTGAFAVRAAERLEDHLGFLAGQVDHGSDFGLRIAAMHAYAVTADLFLRLDPVVARAAYNLEDDDPLHVA